MAITNEMKKRMLERLDPTKPTLNVGIVSIILLKRNSAGTDVEIYTENGIYGGTKSISWKSTVTDTLEQDTAITFNVEQGVYIEGYQLVFDDNASFVGDGGIIDTDTYIFDENGTFTLSNIKITLN